MLMSDDPNKCETNFGPNASSPAFADACTVLSLLEHRLSKWEPDCWLSEPHGVSRVDKQHPAPCGRCLQSAPACTARPPFLSASLCHHTTYAGPPLRQLYLYQSQAFWMGTVWIAVTWTCWQGSQRMIFICHSGYLGCFFRVFFFGCRVPSIFDQRSFKLNQNPVRRQTLWKPSQAACITVKRAMMDMTVLVMWQAGPWRTAVSTLQRLCPRLISRRSLIRVKWLHYWPCGRGFQSRTGPAYCWLLFAIPNWAGRIDQVICWVHGQRLSIPMPAWLTRWNLLSYNPLNSLDNTSDLLVGLHWGILAWQCPLLPGYCAFLITFSVPSRWCCRFM